MTNPSVSNFNGEIKVAAKIIDYLSSGLYNSPAACLKELINNSYDADATKVEVYVKPDADRIIIEDNGEGLDKSDFEKHFTVISESHKRDETDHTPSGRPKIGKIGIGFIAANEICDVMEIISTKEGSSELLDVTIDFALMRQDPATRRREGDAIAKAHYEGHVKKTNKADHFTQVFLKDIRGEARAILSGARRNKYSSGTKSIYGLKASSILGLLSNNQLRSWADFDDYSRNVLRVGLNIPVKYHDNWMPENLSPVIDQITQRADSKNFTVLFDASEVRKPIVFRPPGEAIVEYFKFNGQHVSAEGYFYAQHTTIRPQELQGLLIRIREAAVGEFDPTFMGFSPSLGPLLQSWISAEVHADDRLEDAMNIDRRTLRIAHPSYDELQVAIHEFLGEFIKHVRSQIYRRGSEARRATRASNVEAKILRLASDKESPLPKPSAEFLRKAWRGASQKPATRRQLIRRFTVDELFNIFVQTAREVLTDAQLERFLRALTSKLRGE